MQKGLSPGLSLAFARRTTLLFSIRRIAGQTAAILLLAFAFSPPATLRADLFFNATDNGSFTTVTLKGVGFSTAGLEGIVNSGTFSTSFFPAKGDFGFSGPTDELFSAENGFFIPSFTYGSGWLVDNAIEVGGENPFIFFVAGKGILWTDAENPLPSDGNFFASATYAGTISSLGIDTTQKSITFSNGQNMFFFSAPPADPLGSGGGDIYSVDMGAIDSANSTGTFLPNAQSGAQQSMTNTALNALHNQRIVRARSGMGNPRATSDTLAQSDRHLSKFLHFAANQGMSLGQALGVEETPASVHMDDAMDKVEQLFSVEVPAGGKVAYDAKAPLVDPKRWEIFTVGDFGHHDQDALDTVNRGFQSRTLAGSVGFEFMVCDNFNIGAAYTYADNDTDLDEGLGNVDIEGHLASVYATGFFGGNKYVDVLYSYGTYDNQIRRNTLTPGGFALGSPESDSHTFSINAGQNFDLGEGLVTGPTLGFDYTDGNIDAYNETGGGAAALNYLEREYSSSISSLGWQITKTKEVKQGVLSLQGFAAWEHEFSPESGNVRGSLATSPFAVNGIATGNFNINSPGAAPGTDWMALGVAARLGCHSGVGVMIDYQTQLFRDDVSAHYAGIKLSGEF